MARHAHVLLQGDNQGQLELYARQWPLVRRVTHVCSANPPARVGLHIDSPGSWVEAICSQRARFAQQLSTINHLVAAIVPVCSWEGSIAPHSHASVAACGAGRAGLRSLWRLAWRSRGTHRAPGWPSEYLFVMHEPSASRTGRDVKFSLAMSSMPFLRGLRACGCSHSNRLA